MSIGLVIGLISLSSLALALLLLPLLTRRHGAAGREAYSLTVYRDQLAEIDRDLARGLLDPEQAEAARAEIGRRILTLGPAEQDVAVGAKSLAIAVIAVLLLPIVGLLVYARLGSPALPDQPFAERRGGAAHTAEKAAPADMQEAIGKLRAHLRQHPDDLAGQLLLARSELSLGHYREAADAYRHAAELSGNRPDIAGDWGEAQVLAADGTVTPAAREAFATAVKDAAETPRARYYLALGQLQQGDASGALQAWRSLEAESPAGAEWLPLLRQRIAEAAGRLGPDPTAEKPAEKKATADTAGSPSPSAVAAAAQATTNATPAEREAMIDAMVGRLAARLEQQPEDADGWSRLGRSYMVLHRPDKAREAYVRALKLRPDDPLLQQALAEATAAAAKSAPPTR